VQVQANRLTGDLAAVTGARPVFLPAPGLVSSPALRRALVKYPAIRAALRGAWVNVLITDLDTARGLVEDTEARPADLLSAEGHG
jgi:DNA-binding transcriptional regulator LsrR (DeoR family)